MINSTSITLPYRKCETVYQKLVEANYEELSRYDLRRLISKYCAASSKMKDEYEKRFVEYGFLRSHPRKPNTYLINQKIFFSPDEGQEGKLFASNIAKENQIQYILEINKSDNLHSKTKLEELDQQSKTVVYPSVGGERKKTCSFKGDVKLFKAFKEAVKEDGFPSICFVEHIFHLAYLNARKEAEGTINIPFRVGSLNFFVTIISPYVVERPRRYHRRVEKEIINEEVKWK